MGWAIIEILGVIGLSIWFGDMAAKHDIGWLIVIIVIVALLACGGIWEYHSNKREKEEREVERSARIKKENLLIDKYNDCLKEYRTISNQYFDPNSTSQQNKFKEIHSTAVFIQTEMQKFTWINIEAYKVLKENIPGIIEDMKNAIAQTNTKSWNVQNQKLAGEEKSNTERNKFTKVKSNFESMAELEEWYRRKKREVLTNGGDIEQLNMEYEEQRTLLDD